MRWQTWPNTWNSIWAVQAQAATQQLAAANATIAAVASGWPARTEGDLQEALGKGSRSATRFGSLDQKRRLGRCRRKVVGHLAKATNHRRAAGEANGWHRL